MYNILLIEDDEILASIISGYIKSDPRYTLKWTMCAEEALQLAKQNFDIILMDIMLPDLDGLSLCHQMRQFTYCPIVFISCLNDDETIIKALGLGGDDYITKPFKCPVLLAKMEACLRRNQLYTFQSQEIEVGNILLDKSNHTLHLEGKEIYLSPTEFSMMTFFLKNPGRVLELDEIYNAVWQQPSHGDLRTVPVHVRNLRMKIEQDASNPRYIETVKRIGYRFTP